MPSDLRAIDLATLTIAREVIVASLHNHACQWKQQSSDAIAESRLSNAVMLQNWLRSDARAAGWDPASLDGQNPAQTILV
jgi:hypothetical protein